MSTHAVPPRHKYALRPIYGKSKTRCIHSERKINTLNGREMYPSTTGGARHLSDGLPRVIKPKKI